MNRRPLCLIPSRGGSKRLARKNLIQLGDKPLLAWTIEAALGAKLFDEVWVSSDDEDMLESARQFGASAWPRPETLASDETTVLQLCLVLMEDGLIQQRGYTDLYMMLPTSPFRQSATIQKAWRYFMDSDADALLSVTALDHPPQWSLAETKEGYLKPWQPEAYELPRQQLQPIFREDGGHTIVRLSALQAQRKFLVSKAVPFQPPPEETIDINTEMDLAWANFLLQQGRVD